MQDVGAGKQCLQRSSEVVASSSCALCVLPAVHADPLPKRTLWEHGLRHSVTGAQADWLDYDASQDWLQG